MTDSLLDLTPTTTDVVSDSNVTPTTATAPAAADTTQQNQAAWLIDENIPGTGDRPAWLPEKFKSVADMAKSYGEIEKVNGKTYGAPEQYALGDKLRESVSPDGFNMLSTVAKELNLSQGMFDGIVNSVLAQEQKMAEQRQQQIAALKTQLGNERIDQVKNFITGVGLTPEQSSAISSVIGSVAAFEALEVLMKKVTAASSSAQPAAGSEQATLDVSTKIQQIYAQPDFRTNPAKYHNQLTELYKQRA